MKDSLYIKINQLGELLLKNKNMNISIWDKNAIFMAPAIVFFIILTFPPPPPNMQINMNRLGLEWTQLKVPTKDFSVLDYMYDQKNYFIFFWHKVYLYVEYKFNIPDTLVREFYAQSLLEQNWQKVESTANGDLYIKEKLKLLILNKGNSNWRFEFIHE